MLLLKILHRTDAREIIDHYIHEFFCQRMNSKVKYIISKLDHLNTKNCKVCLYFFDNLFYLIFVVCNLTVSLKGSCFDLLT